MTTQIPTAALASFMDACLCDFIEREWEVIEINTSERNLCVRLANIMRESLPVLLRVHGTCLSESGYEIDPEYNRDGGCTKKTDDNSPITLDIAVHKIGRGHGHNLIAVEMKKINNKDGKASDKQRLQEITKAGGKYGYALGVYVEIKTGKRADSYMCKHNNRLGICSVIYYENGGRHSQDDPVFALPKEPA